MLNNVVYLFCDACFGSQNDRHVEELIVTYNIAMPGETVVPKLIIA